MSGSRGGRGRAEPVGIGAGAWEVGGIGPVVADGDRVAVDELQHVEVVQVGEEGLLTPLI